MFKSYFLVNNYFMQMRVPLMQQSSQKPESIPINGADQLNNSHSFSKKKKKKIGSLNSKDKKNKKRRFSRTRLTRQFGFRSTPARYPSTVEGGRFSLLCETSLTLCPPRQEPQDPGLRPNHMVQLSTWNGRARNLRLLTLPNESNHCSVSLIPSLELQASATQLGALEST